MKEKLLEQLVPVQERVLENLSQLNSYTESATPGWTRRVFSDPYRSSRDWVLQLMSEAGLQTSMDAAGNLIGVLPGRDRSLAPLVSGSHTDTVHGGGRYDGIVGVIGAIEVAHLLKQHQIQLNRDLVIIDFLGEEANNFGVSCIGSRYWSGKLSAEHLQRVDDQTGLTLANTMENFGLDVADLNTSHPLSRQHHAYIELHIEQGPRLEREGIDIGIVTAIAGIDRLFASFIGRPDHSGTASMDDRIDALTAAAEAVLIIERMGCGEHVTTTGKLAVEQGAFNVVPSEAKLWAEMRSIDSSWLTGTKRKLATEIANSALARGVVLDMQWLNDQPPVPTNTSVRDLIGGASTSLGLSSRPIPSGAGHDAAHLVELGPTGMLFIPSVDGRSHVPEEFTHSKDILNGIHVLAASLVAADKA